MSQEELLETVRKVTEEGVRIASHTHYRGGTNDYSVTRTFVEKVMDRSGREHDPVWSSEETEILPGVVTVREDWTEVLRISRDALPVRVLFCQMYEYRCYDDWEHDSVSRLSYWIRYEAAEGAEAGSTSESRNADD
jgi:hypothetical protein